MAGIFKVFLILLALMSGQSIAQMRAMPDAVSVMVLCTGTGAVNVAVDQEGQPVEPAPICPECLVSFAIDAEATPFDTVLRRLLVVSPEWITQDLYGVIQPETQYARGPPLIG